MTTDTADTRYWKPVSAAGYGKWSTANWGRRREDKCAEAEARRAPC